LGASGKNIRVSYGAVQGVGLDIKDRQDLNAWGIHLPQASPHYDVFTHPQSKADGLAFNKL